MAKVVFIAFATEDVRMRDLFKSQALRTDTEYEFEDMPVKEPSFQDWKDKVQIRIRRSHGVIALISRHSLTSGGQRWEINCARAERRKILAVRAYTEDRTMPDSLAGVPIISWEADRIAEFINGL